MGIAALWVVLWAATDDEVVVLESIELVEVVKARVLEAEVEVDEVSVALAFLLPHVAAFLQAC